MILIQTEGNYLKAYVGCIDAHVCLKPFTKERTNDTLEFSTWLSCRHCYVFTRDEKNGIDTNVVRKTASWNLPMKKDCKGA